MCTLGGAIFALRTRYNYRSEDVMGFTRLKIGGAAALMLLAAMSVAQDSASVIKEIVIRGNQFIQTPAIEAKLRTKVGQPYIQSQLDQDRDTIERMGFFRKVEITPTPLEGSNYRITIDLQEFPVTKEFRIIGNTVVKTDDIMKVIAIEKDRPFNLDEQATTGNAIAKLYQDKGYFALVEQLAPLEDSPGTVSIVIRESKVGQVVVTGNNKTSDKVLRRIVKTRPGDVYNEPKWVRELQQVLSTQWFEKVNYDRKPAENGYDIDVSLDLKEARTAQFLFGAAIDPRSSFAGSFGVTDSNFRGTGQSVGLNFTQAIRGGTTVDLNYRNPYMDNRDTSMDVNLYSRVLFRFAGNNFGSSGTLTDQEFNERRTGGSLSFSRPVGDRQRMSLGLRYEAVKTSDVTANNQSTVIKQDGTLLVGGLSYLQNRRDFDLDPARGDWFNLSVEPGFANITDVGGALSDKSILGRNNFVRSSIEYRTYYSDQPRRTRELDAPRRVLALRVKYGVITGKAPFFEQFFAGGSDTLRGYQDDRFWGKQTLLSTLEYRLPLQKSFNAIMFVDYGGAWGGQGTVRDFTQSDKTKLQLGYGIGFGFRTPLGPIRLDFGFDNRAKMRTHFLLGTSF